MRSREKRCPAEVYVYDLLPEWQVDFGKNSLYESEILLHQNFLRSRCRTRDPNSADFFFVPVYTFNYVFHYIEKHSLSLAHSTQDQILGKLHSAVISYLDVNYTETWRRKGGRDHIWVLPYDYGNAFFPITNGILIGPTGPGDWGGLTVGRDFFAPPTVLPNFGVHILNSTKTHYAFYSGSNGAPVRIQFEKILENDTTITRPGHIGKGDYLEYMKQSKLCMCPAGWAGWTGRFFEALMMECVPVIIADLFYEPFKFVIDYSQISYRIQERDMPNLLEIMKTWKDEDIQQKIENIQKVKLWFRYLASGDVDNEPSVFLLLLHWLGIKRLLMLHEFVN